ncbi:MAG: hypothetical protein NTZ14_09965 [Hyphomicrobiales bacterium]|nr:hypothetical protein [Hyphomicrobiales bacterium]
MHSVSVRFGHVMRQWIMAATFEAVLSVCAPAVLTSTTVSGNAINSFFDNVARGASAEDSADLSRFFQRRIKERSDNRPERLRQLVAEAGDQCRESAAGTSCVINREYVKPAAFEGKAAQRSGDGTCPSAGCGQVPKGLIPSFAWS